MSDGSLLGSDAEEVHYKYHLTVIHGKSEYSYKGPVISLMRSANEVRKEFGRTKRFSTLMT